MTKTALDVQSVAGVIGRKLLNANRCCPFNKRALFDADSFCTRTSSAIADNKFGGSFPEKLWSFWKQEQARYRTAVNVGS
jgi:hypothetical protein